MKNILLFLFITVSMASSAQENFKWDQIIVVEGSQYELFIKAKRAISQTNRQHYTDEKNHRITASLKTIVGYTASRSVKDHLNFEYRINILCKNDKIRIIIDDVHCSEKKHDYFKASTQYPGEECGLLLDQFAEVMHELRDNLNARILEIKEELNTPMETYEDW